MVRDIRRGGSAAVDLCAVAAGRMDAYYERGLNYWDYAAGGLIAREAGATWGALRPARRALHGGAPPTRALPASCDAFLSQAEPGTGRAAWPGTDA